MIAPRRILCRQHSSRESRDHCGRNATQRRVGCITLIDMQLLGSYSYSIAWDSVVYFSAVLHCTVGVCVSQVRCSVSDCVLAILHVVRRLNDIEWHDTTWHNMTWHDIIWHDMVWHDLTWNDRAGVSSECHKKEEEDGDDVCRAVTATVYLQILRVREMLRCCYGPVMSRGGIYGWMQMCVSCAVQLDVMLCCVFYCAVLCCATDTRTVVNMG